MGTPSIYRRVGGQGGGGGAKLWGRGGMKINFAGVFKPHIQCNKNIIHGDNYCM